jgi:NAD-dependent deacetylase
MAKHIEAARDLVKKSRRVFVLTGAGVSAESGIPTFRGDGGLWRNFRPEELATPQAFERDPKTVWEWYDWRRGLVAKAEPNAAHRALAALDATRATTIATQNVDGLHQRAGSKHVIEVHGSIWTLRCIACEAQRDDRTSPLPELPPECDCGGLMRPGVVWFGEPLDDLLFAAAMRDAQAFDLTLVVGTSAVVYPAAGLADAAIEAGHPVIEVNAEPTPLSPRATFSLLGKAGEILPVIL